MNAREYANRFRKFVVVHADGTMVSTGGGLLPPLCYDTKEEAERHAECIGGAVVAPEPFTALGGL